MSAKAKSGNTKAVKVRDLSPKKDAKGGAARQQNAGHRSQATGRSGGTSRDAWNNHNETFLSA
jgi:hypothetical protein